MNINIVSAYTDLNVGDQLLYTVDIYDHHENENKRWFEFTPPPEYCENTYWYIHNWDFYAKDVHSYVINQDFGSFAYVNHTYSLYDLKEDTYDESYHWEGPPTNAWVSDGPPCINTYPLDYRYSNLNPDEYFDIYSGVVNLDITDNFGVTWYNTSTTLPFTINGITQPILVDVYSYDYSDSYMNEYWFYDVTYWETVNWGHILTYYVDTVTGYILQYDYTYYDYRDADYTNTSSELGTYFEIEYHYKDLYTSVWKLEETSVGYTPVLDADLPSMIIKSFDHSIDNTTSMISIPFYINNVYPTVTIDVYIDGNYYDTFASNNAGLKFYDILVDDIPFNGPYCSYEIRFDVYDDYNINHNTTWTTWVDDYRTTIPSWGPSWIEGPSYLTVNEGENWFYYNIFCDTNWTVEIYKHDGFGFVFNGGWLGYLNNSIYIYDCLSEGIYYYWVHYYDNVGVFQDIYLTVEVLNESVIIDTLPPSINGPTSTIYMEEGEDKEIKWVLSDSSPFEYEVFKNGVLYDNGTWTSPIMDVIIELDSLGVGTWKFEIIAYDSFGHNTTATVTVVVEEASGNDNNDGNTIQLDAPNVLYVALGFLSITALVAVYRKKK